MTVARVAFSKSSAVTGILEHFIVSNSEEI